MKFQNQNKGWIIILLIFIFLPAHAGKLPQTLEQGVLPHANRGCPDSIVHPLTYTERDFEVYYADKDLRYGKTPLFVSGFWNRWLGKWLRMIGTILSHKAAPVFLYILIFSLCGYIMLRYLRGSAESIWQSNHENSLITVEEGHQVTGTDLAELLQLEISAGNYNKAVRILFLQTVQQLDNHGFISMKQEKTNLAFLHEIQDAQIRSDFRELARIYEFSWYGNQLINRHHFDLITGQFNQFNSRLHA
jgi:hypothetical protein